MAAPPRGRASTIGTAALKSVPLAAFLSRNDSSCPQATFLKGAEENQVERNVLVRTVVVATRTQQKDAASPDRLPVQTH